MKYEIKGIPCERVIKKYTISDDNRTIAVKYLDGTTDYFPYNKETENKIVEIMIRQAEKYVKKEEDVSLKETGHIVKSVASALGSVAFLGCSGLVLTSDPNYYLVGASGVLASVAVVELIKKGAKKRELTYLKKVKAYLENQDSINTTYRTIVEGEKELTGSDMPSEITINNIDSINSSTVSLAVKKCNRYPKIYIKEK